MAASDNETPKEQEASKTLAENLYKRSTEITGKNKTLSLLSKLYEISILALEPKELAERVCDVIQNDLFCELVGISLFDKEKNRLSPLAFSSSERLSKIQEDFGFSFTSITVPIAHSSLIERVIASKGREHTEKLGEIWDGIVPADMLEKIESEGHIKLSLTYPLVSGTETIGVLLISLNRGYDQLIEHEKESIENFTNVVAVALDKALLDVQLKVANDKLRELDRLKSEFLSIASHQLRAPITAVRGYAANVIEGTYGPIPDNLKEPLETIQETSRLMVNSVEDYLNISRIEQGRMKYEMSDVDIADLAKKVVRELTPVATKRGLTLSVEAPEDLTVRADIGKMKQVITNLVDNAIKYTEHGSVTVIVAKHEDKARITIADTGIGIDPEEAKVLFEKFKRARGANKVNTTGTGLGLYVAKQLTEGHEGKIWAESEGAGKGTRFIVELPA